MRSRMDHRGLAPRAALLLALLSPRLATAATAEPTTHPTTTPTAASDAAEVRRLTDVGLPVRAFLASAYESRSASWRSADGAGDADAAMLLGACLENGVGQPADAVAAVAKLNVAAQRGSAFACDLLGIMETGAHGTRYNATDAAARFGRAAQAGDSYGMILLSLCCERGLGVARDPDLALRWAQRAVEVGSRAGLLRLAEVYRRGVGLPVDPAMAVQCIRRAADSGSAQADVDLGDLCVAGGTGGASAGAFWYRRAVDLGDPIAMLRLSVLYLGERLGPPDVAQAMDWTRRAADTGDPAAMLAIGTIYARGLPPTLRADAPMAFAMFRQSVDHGGYTALLRLGMCYLKGRGTPVDLRAGRLCLERGAQAGDRACMAELGRSYLPEVYAGDVDVPLAFSWCKRAAELGDPEGMNLLAICYVKGLGQPADATEAVRWFRLAAEAGNLEAMNSVGLRYEHGEGVKKDPAEAVKWFDMAAGHGDLNGMNNAADRYAKGAGVPVDGAKAERYWLAVERRYLAMGERDRAADVEYRLSSLYIDPRAKIVDVNKAVACAERASANGNWKAWSNLGGASLDGNGIPRNPVAAYGYYRKGAEANDTVAMCGLGLCLQTGAGCEMDLGAAGEWFLKAANLGSSDGMVRLGTIYWQRHSTHAEYQKAAEWFRKAADLGDASGESNLAILMANGLGVPQDVDGALTLARRAEAGGRPGAVGRIGEVYLNGHGSVAKDEARGMALLREAADHGDAASRARLAGGTAPTSEPTTNAATAPGV